MRCQKGKTCVKQPGNAPEPKGRRCSGCDKPGKDRGLEDKHNPRSLESGPFLVRTLIDLVDALEAYMKFTSKEHGALAVFAAHHGWRLGSYEEGLRHRNKIAKLKKQCAKLVVFGKAGD